MRQLRRVSREIGLDADNIPSRSEDETSALVRYFVQQGAERVAVAGGDSTVALAAQELAHKEAALGIIPTGTANNFAAALRLPPDLPSALQVIRTGKVLAVDLGRVGERYFTESAGVGLLADALALLWAQNQQKPAACTLHLCPPAACLPSKPSETLRRR